MDIGFRITHDTLEIQHVLNEMDQLFTKLIVAIENEDTNRHIQAFGTYIGPTNKGKNWAVPFKTILKRTFNIQGPQFSTALRKSENAESYHLKQGQYIYKGYTEEEIAKWEALSYIKPLSYKARKQEISEQYLNGTLTEYQTIDKLLELITEYNVEYYENKLVAYMKMLQMKKNPTLRKLESQNVKNKLFTQINQNLNNALQTELSTPPTL